MTPNDRDELSVQYVERCIKGMTVEMMQSMIRDAMHDMLDTLSEKELKAEVQDVFPDMLKDIE
jgi:hypothetical protein